MLAAIASGTAFGITLAGTSALLAGLDHWRTVWWTFCALAASAVVINLAVLPRALTSPIAHATNQPEAQTTPTTTPLRMVVRAVRTPTARRLFLAALAYGVIGAVYWTFSVSTIAPSFPHAPIGPIFWTTIGISGTAAIAAGRLFNRIGLRRAHTLLFTILGAATATIALAPASWPAIIASAPLYGPAFMATSGLLAVWSYNLFPGHPSTGFTATVLMLGLGSILGPGVLGVVADHAGFPAALLVTAALCFITLPTRPDASQDDEQPQRQNG